MCADLLGTVTTEELLRIAWFGPGPEEGGGSLGVAAISIQQLTARGHEVTAFVAGPSDYSLPAVLAAEPLLHLHYVVVARRLTRALRSHSRALEFFGRQAAKLPAQRRLFRDMMRMHARQPFDVVYAFSQLELPGSASRYSVSSPPIVFHPGVHAAGELRALLREIRLIRSRRMLVFSLTGVVIFSLRAVLQRRSLQSATAVIAMSERFADLIAQDCGVPRSIISVVGHPITGGDVLAVTQPAGVSAILPRNEGTVGGIYIGRIAVRKGIDNLVRASYALAGSAPEIFLSIAGGPSPWSDYRRLLTYLNPVNASYIGVLAHDDVSHAYDANDFALVPSSYEPFGLTAGEALLRGLPVVGTEEVGALEMLPEPAAFVVPAGSPESLAKAISRVSELVQGTSRVELRTTIKAIVGDRFSSDRFGETLERTLRDIALRSVPAAHRPEWSANLNGAE